MLEKIIKCYRCNNLGYLVIKISAICTLFNAAPLRTLSLTTQPASAAIGAYFSDTLPPAKNKPICALEKSKSSTSITTVRPPPLKLIGEPAVRLDANG